MATVKRKTITNIWHSTPISTFDALSKWHEPDNNSFFNSLQVVRMSRLHWLPWRGEQLLWCRKSIYKQSCSFSCQKGFFLKNTQKSAFVFISVFCMIFNWNNLCGNFSWYSQGIQRWLGYVRCFNPPLGILDIHLF